MSFRASTDLLGAFSDLCNQKDLEKEQKYINLFLKDNFDDKIILFILPSFYRNYENPVFKNTGDILNDLYFCVQIIFKDGKVQKIDKKTENVVIDHLAPNQNYSYVTAKCGNYIIRSGYPLLFKNIEELNKIKEIHIKWEYCDSVFSEHILYPEFKGNGKHYLIFDNSFFMFYEFKQKKGLFFNSIDPKDKEIVFRNSEILTDLYPYYIKCHVGKYCYEKINKMNDFRYSFLKKCLTKTEEILIKKIVSYPARYLNEDCGNYIDDEQKLQNCKFVINSILSDLNIDKDIYTEMLGDDYIKIKNTYIYKSPKARMLKEIRITFYKKNEDMVDFCGAATSFMLSNKKYEVQSDGKNELEVFENLINAAGEVIKKYEIVLYKKEQMYSGTASTAQN